MVIHSATSIVRLRMCSREYLGVGVFNSLVPELFCPKIDCSKLSVFRARFYSMQHANCFKLTPF